MFNIYQLWVLHTQNIQRYPFVKVLYQNLRKGETNEVCIFLLNIYSVSNYWVSSFTFYHLVKTREICKH